MRSITIVCAILAASATLLPAATKVTIDPNHVLSINGKKIFPIGFTVAPPPDGKAPSGKWGFQELRDAGAVFMRTGPIRDDADDWGGNWDAKWVVREKQYQDAAAKAGMYCLPWLKELSHLDQGDQKKEQRLREVIRTFKNHPGLAIWKGEDEPQWGEMNKTGSQPPAALINAKRVINEEDPGRPVWIVQAPRGTLEQLKPYNPSYDIGGVDIYPVSFPPGKHSLLPNKEISMVGDYTKKMIEVVEDKKPIWLTLQIAWSGVSRPDKNQLVFPTFPQQRFMTYQSIINGARGLIYFGGSLDVDMNERDKALGWNWTYWDRVLKPVIEEIGDKSPLAEALVQPNSKLPIKASGEGIELCVREVGKTIYLLACSRTGQKYQEITFTGLPLSGEVGGEVVYESPRKVKVKDASFNDWFAPYDVHVYKFARAD
jgi:hypothetical protein